MLRSDPNITVTATGAVTVIAENVLSDKILEFPLHDRAQVEPEVGG